MERREGHRGREIDTHTDTDREWCTDYSLCINSFSQKHSTTYTAHTLKLNYDNFQHEGRTLITLRRREDVIVKPADKDSAVAI